MLSSLSLGAFSSPPSPRADPVRTTAGPVDASDVHRPRTLSAGAALTAAAGSANPPRPRGSALDLMA